MDGAVVRTRLIYEALPIVMKAMPDIPDDELPDIFNRLRIMERAALTVFEEAHARATSNQATKRNHS